MRDDKGRRSAARHAAQSIITSRLLILQSKRLVLGSLQRHLEQLGYEPLRERIALVRAQTETAHYLYRTAVLTHGTPEDADYWLVAYGRLIEVANVVVQRLRAATDDLPAAERYQVSADVEMLEHMVDNWTDAMRRSMGEVA